MLFQLHHIAEHGRQIPQKLTANLEPSNLYYAKEHIFALHSYWHWRSSWKTLQFTHVA